jgi:hypothetical protein
VADRRHVDVLTISDLRLPGGTSASIAEEVHAQARAGLASGLLQADGPLVNKRLPFNPRIAACVESGAATVLVGREPISCEVAVLRHPTVIGAVVADELPPITAGRVVMVANQAPGSADGRPVHYDPVAVDAHVRAWLGTEVVWAPIGPLVRDNLALIAPELALADEDWVNVIDVDRWATERDGVHDVPVIGRHSRSHALKWPATREDVLAAYPDREVDVHVLGGAGPATDLLGRTPDNWTVHDFGALDVRRFLADLDFFVYFHHPDWVEAFGRTILEALASGAVVVVPEVFRPLFGDACRYTTPEGVLDVVRELAADPVAYRAQVERGRHDARARFSYQSHVDRLHALLGRPAPRLIGRRRPQRPRVLFVSSNGAGVGHLMRLMAMARRSTGVDPLFLTLSQALGVVHEQGFPVEYLPSRPTVGAPSKPWHALLRSRLETIIDAHEVGVVVFDGTWPYQGLTDLADLRSDVRLVWSRRAMWRPGITNPTLAEADDFDLVLEPGEFAADDDRGITAQLRGQVLPVAPITFLDRDEQLEPAAARAALGLDPDAPAALVQLGAGNINDTSSQLGLAIERLRRHRGLQICVTRSAIASRTETLPDGVRPVAVYPLATYLRGFDLAVAASGYNTFHELVTTPVPTLFVPNLDTSTDDQQARARFAHRVGVGTMLAADTAEAFDAALAPLLDPAVRTRMVDRALARLTPNGALAASRAIEAVAAGGSPGPDPGAVDAAEIVAEYERQVPGPGAEPAPRPSSRTSEVSRAAAAPEAPEGPEAPEAQPTGGDTPVAVGDPPPVPATSAAASGSAAATSAAASGTAAATSAAASGTAAATSAAASGPTPAAGRPSLRAQVRRAQRRTQRRVAKLASAPEVRRVGGNAFRKLPVETQRVVRRRLRRWERRPDRRRRRARITAATPLKVPAGTVLPETERSSLAGLLVVLPADLDGPPLRDLVDTVAGLQLTHRTFAPLFVTGSTDSAVFRRHGYLFEFLPPQSTWERLADPADHPGYVRDRVADIQRRYVIRHVLTPRSADELLRVAGPLLRP